MGYVTSEGFDTNFYLIFRTLLSCCCLYMEHEVRAYPCLQPACRTSCRKVCIWKCVPQREHCFFSAFRPYTCFKRPKREFSGRSMWVTNVNLKPRKGMLWTKSSRLVGRLSYNSLAKAKIPNTALLRTTVTSVRMPRKPPHFKGSRCCKVWLKNKKREEGVGTWWICLLLSPEAWIGWKWSECFFLLSLLQVQILLLLCAMELLQGSQNCFSVQEDSGFLLAQVLWDMTQDRKRVLSGGSLPEIQYMNFTMRIKSWPTFKRLIKNLLQCVLSYDGINLNSGLREAVIFKAASNLWKRPQTCP